MVTQYPHIITLTATGTSTLDADGNWVPGEETTVTFSCRAEPQTESNHGLIAGPDGTQVSPRWIIYLPLPIADIAVGTKAIINHGLLVLADDTVKRFSKGQLNARIWL